MEHFIRQLKYLFNKGIYGRINKKHKAELIELGIAPEKMEIICDVEKKYFENIGENREKSVSLQPHSIAELIVWTMV